MTVATIRLPALARRLTRRTLIRAAIAGCVWGVAVTAGFAGFDYWECGVVCLSDVALTMGIAVPAGILLIGPLAAHRHETR
jgi:hypothetical protein